VEAPPVSNVILGASVKEGAYHDAMVCLIELPWVLG